MFFIAVFIVAILSGATATVVGFGIGSLMTPLLAVKFGTTTAVALVTLPHAAATAVRCWRWRAHVDRTVLVRFGLLSAGGALAGALIYTRLGPGALTRVLGGLLLLTAVAQLTGWTSRWQPRGPLVAVFGLLFGFFGGIAGNQGGLRSAALTAFGLPPLGFVATATATGLFGGCGADTGLPLELVASDVRALGTHRRRHSRSRHRDHLWRADVTGIVATPFRSDHRRRNRCTRDLDACDAVMSGPEVGRGDRTQREIRIGLLLSVVGVIVTM